MRLILKNLRNGAMFVIVLFLLAISTMQVQASFSIDQQLIEVQATTNESTVGTIRISNYSNQPINISVIPADYIRDERGNVTTCAAGETEHSLFPYVDLSSSYISLEPKSSHSLEYVINLPEEVEGSRWLALYFEPELEPIVADHEDTDKANFAIQVVVAYRTLILATAIGTEAPNGSITGVRLVEGSPSCFEVDLLNTGNVYYRATGWLDIRNEQGETVTTIPIESSFVLPDQTLTIPIADDERELAPGRYLALAVIDFGGDQLVAGQLVFDVD